MRSLILAIIGLAVGFGGLYFLVHRPPAGTPAAPVSAASVYAAAKARVTPFVPPPLPAGAEVRFAQKPLHLHLKLQNGPQNNGESALAPTQQVPQITVNSPAEAEWQAQVNAGQAAYEKQLQAQIDDIQKHQQAAAAAQEQTPSSWITSVLIPLIAAVSGFLTALASVISALREKPEATGKTARS